jgi:Pectate lyase superfamily protein
MRGLGLAFAALLWCAPAWAQNPTCPTRPAGTTGNACASVDFVAQNAAAGFLVTAPPFNAVCDGSTDDSAAINAAITAAAASTLSKIVYIPDRNCKVNSTINLGNGTSSTASTYQGVIIRGLANPNSNVGFPGFTAPPGPKLTWGGSGASGVISVNGPLTGWGVENLSFDCAGIANAVGLLITSAQNGDSRNLTFTNCKQAITSTTVAPFGSFTNTDSLHNSFTNTTITVPNVASAIGIDLTGASGAANTDYNTFINTTILLQGGSNLAQYGIYLQVSDTNQFYDTHIFNVGGNTGMICVNFDYSVSNAFPSATRFTGIDVATCGTGTPFAVSGTPGAGAKPNWLLVDQANGAVCPTNINNLSCQSAQSLMTNAGGNTAPVDVFAAWGATFAPAATCTGATFATNSAQFLTSGKTIFFRTKITSTGTCTTNVVFTLPATPQGDIPIVGKEVAVAGFAITCTLSAGVSTATCSKFDGTAAFNANDAFIIGGSFEKQ